MELRLEAFNKTVEGFVYLANVEFTSLQTILDPRLIDGLENGMIQKFEMTTEQSWKLAKKYLLEKEGVDVKTPKQSIKCFYTSGYLEENQYLLWMQALEDRNVLSYRYDETAYQVALERMKEYSSFYMQLLKVIEENLV